MLVMLLNNMYTCSRKWNLKTHIKNMPKPESPCLYCIVVKVIHIFIDIRFFILFLNTSQAKTRENTAFWCFCNIFRAFRHSANNKKILANISEYTHAIASSAISLSIPLSSLFYQKLRCLLCHLSAPIAMKIWQKMKGWLDKRHDNKNE